MRTCRTCSKTVGCNIFKMLPYLGMGDETRPQSFGCILFIPAPEYQKEDDRLFDRLADSLLQMTDHMEESHQYEIDNEHRHDDLVACPCTYCEAIDRARAIIKDVGGGE